MTINVKYVENIQQYTTTAQNIKSTIFIIILMKMETSRDSEEEGGRMTREERKSRLKAFITCLKCEVSGKCCDVNCSTQYDAGNMGAIIENLEAISKILEQEPCEDCISRAELLKAIDTWDKFGFEHTGCFVREPKDDFITYVHYDDVVKCIKGMPSVQPKTGHWMEEDMFDGDVAYRCSECNELFWIESGTPKDNGYNFCPKCGKRLVEPQESEKINCKTTKCENCKNHNYCDYEPQEGANE